jgi:hypothetical protein
MNRMVCFLCVSSVVLFGLVAQAQGTYTLDQVFAKMDAVAKTFRSTQADIERTHVTILVNDKDVSSGKLLHAKGQGTARETGANQACGSAVTYR